MGYSRALAIVTLDSIRPSPSPAPDTLIFAFSKNGKFSVQKAYQLLKGDRGSQTDNIFWDWLWGKAPLIPKLKLFLWRGVHGALPVRAVLASRIRPVSPLCQLCQKEPETVMHALFHCDFARGAWLASNLGLRTASISGSFKETIHAVATSLSELDVCSFVCMAWAVWRSRNEAMYADKPQSLGACLSFYRKEMTSCQIRLLARPLQRPTTPNLPPAHPQPQEHQREANQVHTHSCYVDGSWDEKGAAGVGICIMRGDTVTCWVSRAIQALSPVQAEARAVLEGFRVMQDMALEEGLIFTDSQEIAFALAQQQPTITDWRSHEEIWHAWILQAQANQRIKTQYCSRGHVNLVRAHKLANQARLYGWDKRGNLEPIFDIQELM